MNVLVTTDGCPFDIEIERMVHLFYEDCQLEIRTVLEQTANGSPDIAVNLALAGSGNRITARGTLVADDKQYTAAHAKDLAPQADHVAVRKQSKQAVLHVLHELFETVTGYHQPWGILTGIRPLKLVHNMIECGLTEPVIRLKLLTEYLISPERADLLLEIASIQTEVVPDLYNLEREVGIYVGIPFCPTHCAYCTFPAYSMTEKATYAKDFLKAMDVEFAHVGRLLREYGLNVTSVYVGGGTPTSLRAPELQHMFESLLREIPGHGAWREFDVEAGRPDTITPDRVAVMRHYGVNRVSVNPQTFKASTLKAIGRGHTPDIVDHRFHYVRDAGFDNINMDMIVGLPGETLDDVHHTIERIARLNPESVTMHTMSFKRSAVVNTERDRFQIASSEAVRRMVAETSMWARGAGYRPYYIYRQMDILGNMENVGYAKPGKESIYNISMMEERQTIIGIGGGAVTKLIGPHATNLGRFANPREPKAFVETIHEVVEKKDKLLRNVFETLVRPKDEHRVYQ